MFDINHFLCGMCCGSVSVCVCAFHLLTKKFYYLHNQHTLQYLRFEKQACFVFLLYFTVNVSMHQTRDLLLTTIPFYISDNVYILRHIGTITQTKWGNIVWKMYYPLTNIVIQAKFWITRNMPHQRWFMCDPVNMKTQLKP